MTRICLALIATLLAFAAPAHAATLWATSASACVPSSATSAGKLHKSKTVSVGFATGKTGKVVLICPIARQDDLAAISVWGLQMNYVDATGPGTKASVTAELYRLPIAGGAAVKVTSVNSDAFPATTTTAFSSLLSHTFDFDNNAYFVKIVLKRSKTSQKVKVDGLFLISG